MDPYQRTPTASDQEQEGTENPYWLVFVLLLAIIAVVMIHRYAPANTSGPAVVKTTLVTVDSLQQIELLDGPWVKPILYTGIEGLNQVDRATAKHVFISALLPAILVARHRVREDSMQLSRLIKKKNWTRADSLFVSNLTDKMKVRNIDSLRHRLISLPNSIVLAQAALETGWGQSRFFLEGNNVFGIWSFDPDEKRLQAGVSRDAPVFVKAYPDMSASIYDYFETLGRVSAYRSLRKARTATNDPFKLIRHLTNYSEMRGWYIKQLRNVIQQNNLTRYDRYQIDPDYLKRV